MELAVDLRQVGGAFTVEENARRLIHYRYAEIAAMEAEAGWVATMAAPKLKITLAQHAYECSLHADAIGRRLPELRVQENIDMSIPPTMRVADVRRAPNEAFERFVQEMQDQDDELETADDDENFEDDDDYDDDNEVDEADVEEE